VTKAKTQICTQAKNTHEVYLCKLFCGHWTHTATELSYHYRSKRTQKICTSLYKKCFL